MKGLSLVEVTIAVALLGIICGISFFIFHQSATLFDEMESASTMIQQLTQGVDMIRWSMLHTISNAEGVYVHVYSNSNDENFPGGYDAWVFPIAYDKYNVFHTDTGYNPSWQGGIVYCPYMKDADSVPQLRRYSFYYKGTGDFTLPFEITYIDNYIEFQDSSVPTPKDIRINRQLGTIPTPESDDWSSGNPLYRVAVSNILKTKVEVDTPLEIILLSSVRGRLENRLSEKSTLYICPRN